MTKPRATWRGCDYCKTVKLFGAYGCANCDRLTGDQQYQTPERKKTIAEAEAKIRAEVDAKIQNEKRLNVENADNSPKLQEPKDNLP